MRWDENIKREEGRGEALLLGGTIRQLSRSLPLMIPIACVSPPSLLFAWNHGSYLVASSSALIMCSAASGDNW